MNHDALASLLRCPICSSSMRYHSRVYSYCCNGPVLHTFRIRSEIPDLVCAEPQGRQKKVDRAFSWVAGQRYERIATGATAFDRFIVRLAYGTTRFIPLLFEFLESVAEDCKPGFFLDIPSGTGVFTAGQYSLQPNLDFIVADYNRAMLASALEKIQAEEFGNVMLVRADACNLPFAPESFTGVLTMKGLACFPDKKKALDEFVRVLKFGGKLAGCFYIKSERLLSDFFLGHFASWIGWYSPPFLTEEEFENELKSRGIGRIVTRKLGAMLFFSGRKIADTEVGEKSLCESGND